MTAGKSLEAIYHMCGGSGHVSLSVWIIIFAISELFASQVCTACMTFVILNQTAVYTSAQGVAFISLMHMLFACVIRQHPLMSGQTACRRTMLLFSVSSVHGLCYGHAPDRHTAPEKQRLLWTVLT